MRKTPIQYIIVVLIIVVVTWLFGCKTAEPFDGRVDGEYIDTTLVYSNPGMWVRDTTPTKDLSIDSLLSQLKDIYAVPADMSNYRYLDTIPALLLVCDTFKYRSMEYQGMYEIDPQVWYKPGHIVIERFAAWAKFSWLFTPAEPTFLDRRKKPLDSKLVVWMVKEL